MSESVEKQETYEELMRRYLDLCNRALEANRNRFPYAAIWQAAEQAMSGKQVEFALVDDEPKVRVQVSMKGAHMDWQDCSCSCGDVPVRRLSADYVRRILADPQKAIDDPSLIDWAWLKASSGR